MSVFVYRIGLKKQMRFKKIFFKKKLHYKTVVQITILECKVHSKMVVINCRHRHISFLRHGLQQRHVTDVICVK